MNNKSKILWLCGWIFSVVTPSTMAAEKGDLILQAGWFFLFPQEDSTPLYTELAPSLAGNVLGIEEQFSSPGTSFEVSDANTPAFTASYFITDHFVIKAEGGIPADFELSGSGVVQPTGPAGEFISVDLGDPQNNPLSTAKQWSPAILGQYYFGKTTDRFRPYLGLGFTYTWFTDVELDSDFEQSIKDNFGATLGLATGNSGPYSVEANSTDDLAPIINAGFSYDIDDRWSTSFSLSYVFLESTAEITLRAENGEMLAKSATDLDLGTMVGSFLISYRWGKL